MGMDTVRQPQQCRGTGINVRRIDAPSVRCIIMTSHPSGFCNFCRRTEGIK